MEFLFTGLVIFLFLIIAGVLIHQTQELKRVREHLTSDPTAQLITTNLQGMHSRLDESSKTMNERLQSTQHQMSTTLSTLSELMGNVGKELGGVRAIGQQISKFQEFLNSPKLRGNIGEQILYDSLHKTLPKESVQEQYKFKNGATVDALIATDKGGIPVDSKFPMDFYRRYAETKDKDQATTLRSEFLRSVKKYIDDISTKYILPEEGTLDFAVMYVPAEQVYYEMINDDHDLMSYAHERKVLVVSPNSFFHFLRIILIGLEKAKFAEEAEKIWGLVTALQNDFSKFGKQIEVLSRHLTNAKNSVDLVSSEYQRIDSKLDNIKLIK